MSEVVFKTWTKDKLEFLQLDFAWSSFFGKKKKKKKKIFWINVEPEFFTRL